MTYTKPLPISEDVEGTSYEISYGPHEGFYRVTVTHEPGVTWAVDFNSLGMIERVDADFDDPPTWKQASTAIQMALTTYLMQHNT